MGDYKAPSGEKDTGYWVVHSSDTLVLVCWYEDDTGELVFCDVYA